MRALAYQLFLQTANQTARNSLAVLFSLEKFYTFALYAESVLINGDPERLKLFPGGLLHHIHAR